MVNLVIVQCSMILILTLGTSPRLKVRAALYLLVLTVNIYTYLSPVADLSTKSGYITNLIMMTDFLLITDAQRNLFRSHQKRPIAEESFFERLKWSAALYTNPRGIGWKHELRPPYAPPRPSMTPQSFILNQLKWVFIYYILQDITGAFIVDRMPPFSRSNTSLIVSLPLLQRSIAVIASFILEYTFLVIPFMWFSIITVAFGIYEPSDWPHLFGEWKYAFTLRRFWGNTWQQMLRRCLSVPSKFLAHNVFRFKQGSKASSYTQLYTAFFLSGVLHTLTFSLDMSGFDFRPLVYFSIQAVAITFEDIVITLFKGNSLGRFGHIVGYVWTFGWFVYSKPPWIDSNVVIGFTESCRIQFSLVSWLIKSLDPI